MTPEVAAHGTRSGYLRHSKNGERPCDPCRAAELEYQARRRRRNM